MYFHCSAGKQTGLLCMRTQAGALQCMRCDPQALELPRWLPSAGISLVSLSQSTGQILPFFYVCHDMKKSGKYCYQWIYVRIWKSRTCWLYCPSLPKKLRGVDFIFIFEFPRLVCCSGSNKRMFQGEGRDQLYQMKLIKQILRQKPDYWM